MRSGPRKGRDLRAAAAREHRVSKHLLREAHEELKIRITHVNIGKRVVLGNTWPEVHDPK